jgi:hypothetical protein
MSQSLSKRRMAENQVVFRKHNEKVQKSIDELNAVAAEEGTKAIHLDDDIPLYFYCECSDENCRERIKVTLKDYNKIHRARDRFVIMPGHNVPEIENVTKEKSKYWVVTKHEVPRKSVKNLKTTNVNNV